MGNQPTIDELKKKSNFCPPKGELCDYMTAWGNPDVGEWGVPYGAQYHSCQISEPFVRAELKAMYKVIH